MLLDALGDISDEYVMGAQKYLTNDVLKITNSKAHQRTVPQKLLILAATIAAVMSLLVTAMAVNEDFREKVFEFFHISTSENVPNGGDLATSGLDTVIGEACFRKILGLCGGHGICRQRDFVSTRNAMPTEIWKMFCFMRSEKDGLSALKTSSVQFELKDDELAGNGRIFWCKSENGAMAIGNGQMLDGQRSWNVSTIAGQPDKALFSVYGGILSKFDFSVFLFRPANRDTAQIEHSNALPCSRNPAHIESELCVDLGTNSRQPAEPTVCMQFAVWRDVPIDSDGKMPIAVTLLHIWWTMIP